MIHDPVILFGTGRSGSTLFMNCIFRHRELAFFTNILERNPKWMWTNRLRSLTDNQYYRLFPEQLPKPFQKLFLKPVEGYSIWNELVGKEIDFSRSFIDNVNISDDLSSIVYTYIKNIIKTQERTRFAFKITGPGRLELMDNLFPDAHLVWLKRRFIPTLSSFLNVEFWQKRATGELWWESPEIEEILSSLQSIKKDPVLFTTFQLQAIISNIKRTINRLKLRVLEVNYRDFTANPNTLLMNTLEFCSLDQDPCCFQFLQNSKISNRNKKDESYFGRNKLKEIQDLRRLFKKKYGVE